MARQRAEDILENKSRELYEKNQSLLQAYNELRDQKAQLLHQEKLASIGQLSAGIAHEINNPAGFVKSNINSLQRYTKNMVEMLNAYETQINQLNDTGRLPDSVSQSLSNKRQQLDIEYVFF